MLFRISYAFLRKASCDFFIFISIFVFSLKDDPLAFFTLTYIEVPKRLTVGFLSPIRLAVHFRLPSFRLAVKKASRWLLASR
jgi:hypothetical protein